ncbi:MAG: ATP-dependent helicase [Rhodobacteraceae bacterium]|nr:ATP-dependent helicase [Paracoccaceae bacterium]
MNTQLSDAQRAVVEYTTDTAVQVLASAGSGKTRVLTERINHILSNTKKVGVIGLTFTNKAAEEMSTRLDLLGAPAERIWIGTVHSIAQRILEQYGHTIGLPPEFQIYEKDKDRMEVFLEALRSDGVNIDDYLDVDDAKEKRSRERNLQNYMDGFSSIKRDMLSEEDIADNFPDAPDVWRVFTDYQSALINSGGIDYDDILKFAHRILSTQDWVGDIYRAKFKHICVDEAQDLNKIQYEFVKALAGDTIKSVMMVGDPDQMIYGFNGSSATYMCDHFVSDFKPAQFRLTENFRSTKAVVHIANKLRPNSQKVHDYALDGVAKVYGHGDEHQEAAWIVSSINRLLEIGNHPEIEGKISTDKMVIIARNRFVFSTLEKALEDAEIDFHLRQGERAKDPTSRFGKTLDYAIRFNLNPKDWVDGRKLCHTLSIQPPSTWGDSALLQQFSDSLKNRESGIDHILSELLTAIDGLDKEKPNIRKLVSTFSAELEALADKVHENGIQSDIERSLEELEEFSASWVNFRKLGLGSSLGAFRNAAALGKLNTQKTSDGLMLSTVHTMKGLEKDIVFLIGMCEGVFPDYRATTPQKIEEERNTAFVAVTRAKRWIFMSYPKQRMMPWKTLRFQQPSRFLAEIGIPTVT